MLCQHNSDVRRLDANKATLTYYHSTEEPPVTVAAYLDRIARYSECGIEGVLLGLRLVGRCHATAGVTLTRLSAHRLAITGLTIGVKMHMDRFRSNRTVAKAGGLQLKELNGLEYAFFRELGYRAVVTQEELEHMELLSARALELFASQQVEQAARCAADALSGLPATPRSLGGLKMPPRTQSQESLQSLGDDEEASPDSLYKPSPAVNRVIDEQCHRDPSTMSMLNADATLRASSGMLRAALPRPPSTARLQRFPPPLDVSASVCRSTDSAPLESSTRSNASECVALVRFRSRAINIWRPSTLQGELSSFMESEPTVSDLASAAP